MNFVVGIFDLLTYAIPGSLYLTFAGYLVFRLHLQTGLSLTGGPAWLLVVGVVLASYLLGYLAYPIGAAINKVVPNRRRFNPLNEFLRRVPTAADRAFVQADSHLLQAAVELHDKEAAAEISRLRAAGLMLRNCAPPMVLGLGTAAVEVFAGDHLALALGGVVVFGALAAALVVQGRRLGRWATSKTLELSFWLPDIDDRYRKSS